MKVYIVYRIDHIRHVRETVGAVLERRKLDRGNNFEGILKLAKIVYPPSPDSHIDLSLK